MVAQDCVEGGGRPRVRRRACALTVGVGGDGRLRGSDEDASMSRNMAARSREVSKSRAGGGFERRRDVRCDRERETKRSSMEKHQL